MPIHNADIAAIFEEIAELLEIQNENPFRIRAYRNAARQVEGMGVPVADMVAKGEDLTELPGIGDDLAAKIQEIVATGQCKALEKLRKQVPPSITELLKIPGLGPKRVRALYDTLKVKSIDQLAKAAQAGKIRELEGFGEKTEQTILAALAAHVTEQKRFKLAIAAQYAEPLKQYLEKVPGVQQVVLAGSYRRFKETVGDIDILVTATGAEKVMDKFTTYDEVREVLAKGETRATVILKCNLQVDVRVVDPDCYGAALQYFTGSRRTTSKSAASPRSASSRSASTACSGVKDASRAKPKSRSIAPSICPGYHPSSERTAARSRRHAPANCPNSSNSRN